MLMSCRAALCLLLRPLLPLVLYRPDLIPHILFPDPDRFIALALDHPILPLPPEFQHPSPSNRLPYAAPPPPPLSPADSPHFETNRLGRKLIAIGDCHPPSPPPLVLDCNKAPASNPPPPPPPSPLILDCNKAPASNPPPPPPPLPSPADSPHFETYRLGRKLKAIGDCHPPSPPLHVLDCNKAPTLNPPPPPTPPPSPADSSHFETYCLGRKLIAIGDYHPPSPPLILDCNKAPASNRPPLLLLLLLFPNSSQCLIALEGASRKVHWTLGSNFVIKPSRSLVVHDCEKLSGDILRVPYVDLAEQSRDNRNRKVYTQAGLPFRV